MMRALRAFLPLLLLGLAAMHARAEALFDAKSTYAVVAGVLEWKDPGLASFPKEDRKDKALFETLGQLGVPASQRPGRRWIPARDGRRGARRRGSRERGQRQGEHGESGRPARHRAPSIRGRKPESTSGDLAVFALQCALPPAG